MKLCNTVETYVGLKQLVIAICVAGLLTASAPLAAAQVVSFGPNSYEFVLVTDPYSGDNNFWDTVRAAAAARVYKGVKGHLATITSQEENDFLWALAGGPQPSVAGAWLGGKEPEGWLVGPEAGQSFSYTNWNTISEPNNNGYAYMDRFIGKWGDDSGVQGLPDPVLDPVVGYFVEYEGTAELECDFSISPDINIQRCFGGIGAQCNGFPFDFYPNQDTCQVQGWMSVGSILHDGCCLDHNNNGFMCDGLKSLRKLACLPEFSQATEDAACGRFWPVTFGPYIVGEDGDDTSKVLKAPSGAHVHPDFEHLCQSGVCQKDPKGRPFGNGRCEFCICL